MDELRGDPRIHADLAFFENSLLEYGWMDLHRDQYAQKGYKLARRRCFAVRDDFPRLSPSTLPTGISGTSYLLDLSSCGPYQVSEETIEQSLTQVISTVEG